ncbi:hypothetical protein [Sorangium sp. So ce1389]|uniref:hypothetical protein n=1 Tax=Sorangium sp. So ce1389 TaxID=3133336 RepID=UPI003F614B6C
MWPNGAPCAVVEDGAIVSKSTIHGIGDEYIGTWTKIPGAICNGFDSSKQFTFSEPITAAEGPFVLTDEDWITHAGGLLSALSRLR